MAVGGRASALLVIASAAKQSMAASARRPPWIALSLCSSQ
jgi:hypothetical protein